MAGKGNRYRPVDRKKWEAGYARVFGKGRTVRRPCPHVDVDACVPCMECMMASIDWADHPQRELFDTVLKDLPPLRSFEDGSVYAPLPAFFGKPCDHPGCRNHISHPCERCGHQRDQKEKK